ncbi:MAG: DUF5069 domain-containing protein [Candidatus Sericytochromatia bacterium]|nr:DUF5069 domain-containing protein [Candidatus Tanganyikabacteria bacterium]
MTASEAWEPRSWREKLCGCYWLGRMVDKGRRKLQSEEAGDPALLNDYQFGDHNPSDAIMLRFLGLRGAEILELLRQHADDEKAGAVILAKGGWDAAAIARWNFWLPRLYAFVLVGLDADEGRLPPTLGNRLIMAAMRNVIRPPVAAWYRFREGR